eukprot:GHRR01033339.1.p1 GENE.GHRR01033339.1~~GHRR01033339.1.p1  ORF type:complete len:214 (+),score=52.41 GHRR01033339.1:77-718(+)
MLMSGQKGHRLTASNGAMLLGVLPMQWLRMAYLFVNAPCKLLHCNTRLAYMAKLRFGSFNRVCTWHACAVAETGSIPPGNAPGETKWQNRTAARPKADIKLTAGKAINVPIETLIDQVVKGNKVVAFVKGTRSAPQCGFSYKMLTILNELKTDYEVVNVLDDFYNPGLREAIKQYSQWPTIPQLYINGEFIGGSDIVEQMQASRELQQVLAGK